DTVFEWASEVGKVFKREGGGMEREGGGMTDGWRRECVGISVSIPDPSVGALGFKFDLNPRPKGRGMHEISVRAINTITPTQVSGYESGRIEMCWLRRPKIQKLQTQSRDVISDKSEKYKRAPRTPSQSRRGICLE